MKLSIVIPTYKREKILCQTIDSVLKELGNSSLTEGDYELIIVDQTKEHTPDVTSYLERLNVYPFVKYIYESVANLPNARNVGISYAQGDIILFLDDDVVLHPGFFDILIKDYQDHPEVCSVVGSAILKNESGENILLQSESKFKKAIRRCMTTLFCGNKASVISSSGLMFSNRENSGACYAESGRGCLMSFLANVIHELKGFDKNYQGNALREESDLFVRIKRAGLRVYFDPKVSVDHIMANVGGCRAERSKDYWQTFFNNQLYFYRKNFEFSNWYIKCLLVLSIKQIRKQGYDVDVLFANAYKRSVELLGK